MQFLATFSKVPLFMNCHSTKWVKAQQYPSLRQPQQQQKQQRKVYIRLGLQGETEL
jgi:hypothetical protein